MTRNIHTTGHQLPQRMMSEATNQITRMIGVPHCEISATARSQHAESIGQPQRVCGVYREAAPRLFRR